MERDTSCSRRIGRDKPIAKVGSGRDRGAQIHRQQKQHAVERQLNALLSRGARRTHAQLGALADMFDRKHDEITSRRRPSRKSNLHVAVP